MTVRPPEFQEDKFKELIVYISGKCQHDPYFGALKLNKLLYLSDMLAFAQFGKSVTGSEYVARQFGPTPRRLVPVRERLVKSGAIVVRTVDKYVGRHPQQQVVPLRPADLSAFSGAEIALVDALIEDSADSTGTELSNFAHRTYAWGLAQMGETIPYEAVFLCGAPATEADKRRAAQLADQYEWER